MSKNNSFFLQFLAVKNGTVIPYTKDTGDKLPEIDNTEVTELVLIHIFWILLLYRAI